MRTRGFTLIEVMVTVAIVAILAAIAIPSYSDYVLRGRLTEALSGLSGMRVKMEQFFQDNRSYVGACVGGTVAPKPTSTYFTYTCTLNPNTYTISAQGVAGGPMEPFKYSLDETNTRVTLSVPSTWVANPACWTIRSDGSC